MSRPLNRAWHRRLPLRLERLEGRDVPAVIQVTNLNEGGNGSLRAAISVANQSTDTDIIKIEVIGTLTLDTDEMNIFTDVTIVGPGSGFFTIDAAGDSGVFNIGTEGTLHVSISGMTLTNGNDSAIEASFCELILADMVITNFDGSNGGGIRTSSNTNLIMDNCVVSGNNAFRGGGIYLGYNSIGQFRDSTISGNQTNGRGGGIYSSSNNTVSIERCTIANNLTFPTKGSSDGGGLFVASSNSLNVQDSTFSGNSAFGSGGGIYISGFTIFQPGERGSGLDGQDNEGFTINNSTISGNTATFSGGGVYIEENNIIFPLRGSGDGYFFPLPGEILHCTITGNVVAFDDGGEGEQRPSQADQGTGGGVSTGIEIDVVNTIIALNTAATNPDIHTFDEGNFVLSFSLIGDVGSASTDDNGGNIFGEDPLLGPLQNNGGPTETHELLEGSPAIDTGDPNFQNPPDAPVFDQRGANFSRVVFGTTDMGAFEVQEEDEGPGPGPGPTPGPTPTPVTRFLKAVGAGAGTTAQVKVFDEQNNLVCIFDAYPRFTGGVRVAVADIDGDGIEDVITSPGSNGGPHIQVFNGAKLLNGVAERVISAIGSYFSYDPFWTGGVFVGTGDVNGDGWTDIITGADASGGPHVVAWDNRTGDAIVSFYAYDVNFTGGVRVAGGDINGDGTFEIVTGAGVGGGPHVRAFSNTGAILRDFFAYDASFLGGVYVASGDINGDGNDDIITGAGEGGGSHTRVLSGVDLSVLRDFFAYDVNWKGGVRVSSFDFNFDGRDDIITGAGPTGGPHGIAYSGVDNSILASAYVWELPFGFGIYVA